MMKFVKIVNLIIHAALIVFLFSQWSLGAVGNLFEINVPWIEAVGVNFIFRLDGLSLIFVMMSLLISFAAFVSTFAEDNVKEYLCKLMILVAAVGSFMAQDLFLFYVCWEVVLLPIFLLIVLKGKENFSKPLMTFFLYTLFASLVMLAGIITLGSHYKTTHGMFSYDIANLVNAILPFDGSSWQSAIGSKQTLVMLAFFIAAAVKGHIFPFHSWLPKLYQVGTNFTNIMLAGVLFNMGSYALIRFIPSFFPDAYAYYGHFFMTLGAIGIVYGALCALAETSTKKLLAYASVSHMGFFVMGFFALNHTAFTGAVYQTVNHGFIAAALFIVLNFFHERDNREEFNQFGGFATKLPLLSICFFIVILAAVALPGTNGFSGELPVLLGTFQSSPWISALGGLGVILGAIYSLQFYQKIFLGKTRSEKEVHDLNAREIFLGACLTVLIFFLGVFPSKYFSVSHLKINEIFNSSENI
jgi:NADH-quinone oxidoreductase subunit M